MRCTPHHTHPTLSRDAHHTTNTPPCPISEAPTKVRETRTGALAHWLHATGGTTAGGRNAPRESLSCQQAAEGSMEHKLRLDSNRKPEYRRGPPPTLCTRSPRLVVLASRDSVGPPRASVPLPWRKGSRDQPVVSCYSCQKPFSTASADLMELVVCLSKDKHRTSSRSVRVVAVEALGNLTGALPAHGP